MSEYIVEYPDDLVAKGYIENCINIHERIVRCKECREYIAFDKASRLGGFGICELLEDKRHGTSYAIENGFCAWGKRRED